MKWLISFILLGLSNSLLGQVADWQKFTLEFYQELNLARTNPQEYARIIEAQMEARIINDAYVARQEVETKDGEKKIYRSLLQLKEGKAAFIEAIDFLKKQEALKPLNLSINISRSAQDHAEDLGDKNITGHLSSDQTTSPMDRIARYGVPVGMTGEVLMFGPNLSAREMVIFLIVDDGVPDRGHRLNIFDPGFSKVGVACGAHPTFSRMCGANFTEDYWEDKEMQIGEVLISRDTVLLNDYRQNFLKLVETDKEIPKTTKDFR